ncbi:MAG: hypothetical protein E7668_07325 [Ruminococcaceae bacterium]|nr:hypothetical protein [Oscillospiraceae bacterium]
MLKPPPLLLSPLLFSPLLSSLLFSPLLSSLLFSPLLFSPLLSVPSFLPSASASPFGVAACSCSASPFVTSSSSQDTATHATHSTNARIKNNLTKFFILFSFLFLACFTSISSIRIVYHTSTKLSSEKNIFPYFLAVLS